MPDIEEIKKCIEEDKPHEAILLLESLIKKTPKNDYLLYLQGNAFLKTGNWQKAMESFLEAEHLNPESPAREALTMTRQILNFYCKDVYGQ